MVSAPLHQISLIDFFHVNDILSEICRVQLVKYLGSSIVRIDLIRWRFLHSAAHHIDFRGFSCCSLYICLVVIQFENWSWLTNTSF